MNSEDTSRSYRKFFLLIILLLFLFVGCFWIGYKLGKTNAPRYDADPDIFEINGGENNNNSNSDNNSNTSDNTNFDTNDININNNGNYNSINSNQSKINSSNDVIIDNNNNTASNVISKEEDRNFIVNDNNVNWNSTEKIDIFKNSYFDYQNKIAPGVSSTYNFIVKNNTDYMLSYQIKMTEVNNYNINMKYRLKKNNEYIIGAEDTWVDASKLNLANQIITTSNNDTYSLEWKWFDSDNDNEIGRMDSADYFLSISIIAEDYEA